MLTPNQKYILDKHPGPVLEFEADKRMRIRIYMLCEMIRSK